MKLLARSARTLVTGLGVAVLLALGGTLPAFAAAGSAGVTFTGGSLSGGTITYSDFTPVTLDGTEQTVNTSWNIANITDATGSGAGWNLSLTLSQFTEYTTSTSTYVTPSPKTLSTGVPPVATTTALDTTSAVKLLDAAAGDGMGAYDIAAMTVKLTIMPKEAYVLPVGDAYETTGTLSLNSAP
jgi:hypothetical protein